MIVVIFVLLPTLCVRITSSGNMLDVTLLALIIGGSEPTLWARLISALHSQTPPLPS